MTVISFEYEKPIFEKIQDENDLMNEIEVEGQNISNQILANLKK